MLFCADLMFTLLLHVCSQYMYDFVPLHNLLYSCFFTHIVGTFCSGFPVVYCIRSTEISICAGSGDEINFLQSAKVHPEADPCLQEQTCLRTVK